MKICLFLLNFMQKKIYLTLFDNKYVCNVCIIAKNYTYCMIINNYGVKKMALFLLIFFIFSIMYYYQEWV